MDVTVYADRLPAVDDVRSVLSGDGIVGVDIETNRARPYYDSAKVLSVAASDGNRAVAIYGGQEACRLMAQALAGRTLVAHNLAFELEWLRRKGHGQWWGMDWHDTMLAAYVLDERRGGHDLDFCSAVYLGTRIKHVHGLDRTSLETVPPQVLCRYNALDAYVAARLWRVLWPRLRQEGLTGLYQDHLRRVRPLVAAQAIGLPVDMQQVRDLLRSLEDEYAQVRTTLESTDAYKRAVYAHGIFDPLSHTGLRKLYSILYPDRHFSSFDDEHLKALDDPCSPLILRLRRLEKLLGTYVRPFATGDHVYPDGRVHTSFLQHGTASGRLSSRDPNMQNIDKRDKRIRAQFVAPSGYRILAVDYSQLEVRVLALASADDVLLDELRHGVDIHRRWAEWAQRELPGYADMPLDKVRRKIKGAFVFALFYGAGHKTVGRQLGCPGHPAIAPAISAFKAHYRGVAAWQDSQFRQYEARGYVETLTGRRRRWALPWNAIINHCIQGTASDICMDAMVRLYHKAIAERDVCYQPVLNVHDELVFFVPAGRETEYARAISQVMQRPSYDWAGDMIFPVAAKCGDNWGNMHELGGEVQAG